MGNLKYHQGQRLLQERFGARGMADRISERMTNSVIDADDQAFIESVDMFFLATVDDEGHPTCSYKGGDRGFVRVVDPHTLAFPNYDGNGMFASTGNMLVNPQVGMLFISFENPRRLRVQGEASIADEDPLLTQYPEAQLIVRVRVRVVFTNCQRYIHRYRLEERSIYVPRQGRRTPLAEWKRSAWVVDKLPTGDPAASLLYRLRGRLANVVGWLIGRRPGRYTG